MHQQLVAILCLFHLASWSISCAFSLASNYRGLAFKTSRLTSLNGARNRAWSKGDLSDEDIFGDDDNSVNASPKKQKFKLEPETTFFEGPPSSTEVILPAISILTVIGIVPFISALSRQFWVRYKFTSRRIGIQSGFGGKVQTEIIYPDIGEIRFVYRAFGSAGDMVLFLKDGAKVELRHVPNFNSIYSYVLSKCDDECKQKSMQLRLAGEGI
jgi:hypothetical protein